MLWPGALLAPRLTSPDGDRDIILAAFTGRITPPRCAIGYVAEWEVATVGLAPTGPHSLQAARLSRVARRRRGLGGLSLRCRLFRWTVPQYATLPDFLQAL